MKFHKTLHFIKNICISVRIDAFGEISILRWYKPASVINKEKAIVKNELSDRVPVTELALETEMHLLHHSVQETLQP